MRFHPTQASSRRFFWTLLAAAGAGLALAAPLAALGSDARNVPEATYEVTFQGNWTAASTPGDSVEDAYFTTLIGAVHNDGVTFWRCGGRATPGVELVAETGETTRFAADVKTNPHAGKVIRQRIGQGGTSSKTFTIHVTADQPLITLLSMIGPSPDWFVGVSGLPLLDAAGHWTPRREIALFPYDAGTKEGDNFSRNHPPTVPQGEITILRGMGAFSDQPLARLTFVRRQG